MKPDSLRLSEIDFDDDRFRISYFSPLEPLIRSIRKLGVISPIPVTCRNRKMVLVCGWRRGLACRELELRHIPGQVLEEKDDRKVFEVALNEKLAVRSLTLVETAEVLRKLTGFGVSMEQLRREFLPQLGLPATWECLETYLGVAECIPEVRRMFEERESQITVAEKLSGFLTEDQRLLWPWLSVLSQNKQKELLENLQEICQREGLSVRAFLEELQIRLVQTEERLSLRQKAGRILDLIRERRFPQLSALRSRLASRLKSLDLPEDIALRCDPNFEEEGMSVNFRFRDSSEFIGRLKKLRQMADDPRFEDLFKILSGE